MDRASQRFVRNCANDDRVQQVGNRAGQDGPNYGGENPLSLLKNASKGLPSGYRCHEPEFLPRETACNLITGRPDSSVSQATMIGPAASGTAMITGSRAWPANWVGRSLPEAKQYNSPGCSLSQTA
jgi:hypothetical protein